MTVNTCKIKHEEVGVHSFIDSDWDGNTDDRWSTNGYVFILFQCAFSWMIRKNMWWPCQQQWMNTLQPLMQEKR